MKSGSKSFNRCSVVTMTTPLAAGTEMKKKDTIRTPQLDAELIGLADAHKRLIDSICRAACPFSESDRKDLRQEILIRALESYPAFRREARFSTWLYRLAINTASVWRRKLPKGNVEFNERLHDVAEEQPAENHSDDRISQLFSQVDFWDGMILALMLEGHDKAEIGELIGLKTEAVRKRLERLRKRIIYY